MSNVLGHRFVSPKLDGTDLTQVQPSAWNDGHRFTGGVTGDALTRDTADATFGATWTSPEAWTPYVPSWWVNEVLVTVPGDHTFLSASYWRRGNFVAFQIYFRVGATFVPVGAWHFSLPFTPLAQMTPGGGLLLTSVAWPLFAFSTGGNRFLLLYLTPAGSCGAFTKTEPAALAAGHTLEIRGTFQAV